MPVRVLAAAIGQPSVVERLLAVDLLERLAGNESLVRTGDIAPELPVRVLDATVEDRNADTSIAERGRPRGRNVHPRVVPLEDSLRVRHAEEGRGVVPRVGEAAATFAEARRVDQAAAALAVVQSRTVEHRLAEERGDAGVGAELGAEIGGARGNRHRAERAQVRDDLTARGRDGRLHLRRSRSRREADDRDPERVRSRMGVARSNSEDRCRAGRQENEPLHRTPDFGSGSRLC